MHSSWGHGQLLVLNKTHELWKEKKPNVSFFHPFGCKYYVLNNRKDNLDKFDSKLDEAILLGYPTTRKAFRVFNKRILIVEESVHVTCNESNDLASKNITKHGYVGIEANMKDLAINQENEEHQENIFKKESQQEADLPPNDSPNHR